MTRVLFLMTVVALAERASADEPKPLVQLKRISQMSVEGKGAPATPAIDYDPVNKVLATASCEYTEDPKDPDAEVWRTARGILQLWEPLNGTHIANFQGSAGPFYDVAFSPDGTLIATAGRKQNDTESAEVKLWNVKTLKETATLEGNKMLCVDFSPDGKWLATGGFDKLAKVWDVASGKLVTTLPEHGSYVQIVQFTKDGKTLFTADQKGVVTFWNTSKWGQKRWEIKADGLRLNDAQLSPDETKIALAGTKIESPMLGPNVGKVHVWDVPSMKEIAVLETGKLTSSVAFSPNGKWIAVHGLNRELQIINMATQQKLLIELNSTTSEATVKFLLDGKLAFTSNQRVELWSPGSTAD